MHATAAPFCEYACHEGSYAMPLILAGARYEKKSREKLNRLGISKKKGS